MKSGEEFDSLQEPYRTNLIFTASLLYDQHLFNQNRQYISPESMLVVFQDKEQGFHFSVVGP